MESCLHILHFEPLPQQLFQLRIWIVGILEKLICVWIELKVIIVERFMLDRVLYLANWLWSVFPYVDLIVKFHLWIKLFTTPVAWFELLAFLTACFSRSTAYDRLTLVLLKIVSPSFDPIFRHRGQMLPLVDYPLLYHIKFFTLFFNNHNVLVLSVVHFFSY